MNAPTGRNISVSVIENAIAGSFTPKSCAIRGREMTTRKKSNASSVHPRNPAETANIASRIGTGDCESPSDTAATDVIPMLRQISEWQSYCRGNLIPGNMNESVEHQKVEKAEGRIRTDNPRFTKAVLYR